MFMLALVITIIIVDTLFRPHLTIMSSTIYMYRSVHKKNPIKIGEGEKLIWGGGGGNEYVLTHTWFFGGKIQYILIFSEENLSIYSFFRGGGNWVYTHLSGGRMSMGEK